MKKTIKTNKNKLMLTLTSFLMVGLLVAGCSNDSNPSGPNAEIDLPIQVSAQSPVNLNTAGNYVILAGSQIANLSTSVITGDLGISPAAAGFITGFSLVHTAGTPSSTSSQVTGSVFASDYASPTPAALTAAKGDLTIAYNNAAGRTSTDIVLLSGNIGGLTLTPGLYKSSGPIEISSGDVTFDAKGNANAVFIIQIASTLTTTSGRKVILAGGAKASNIFWQVGTSATLGTTTVFKGTIMADQSITLNTGTNVEGRLLARIAAVTVNASTLTQPS